MRSLGLACGVGVMVVSLAITGLAVRANAQSVQGLVEPKADELLRKMSQTLAAAQEFSLETHNLTDQVTETGQKLQFSKHIAVKVRRPNAILAEVRGDVEQFRFVYDGGSVHLFNPNRNEYASVAAPGTIDATLDMLANRYGMAMPLADLLFSNPYDSLIGRVRAGVYVGLHQVSGVPCHHLAFRQDNVDWQIWIEDGELPMPRKIVIDYKQLPARPQFTATIDRWNLKPQTNAETFRFTPPAGATKIDLATVEQQGPATQPSENN